MTWIVLVFGILIASIGCIGIARPDDLIRFIQSFWKTSAGFYVAIGIRLLMGAVFIFAAPDCRFPAVIRILGIVSVIGAAAGAIMGLERIRSFVEWWASRSTLFVRMWSTVAAGFGGLLVYAAT